MDYYIKFIRCTCTSSNIFLPKDSDQFKYLFLLKAKKCGLKLFLGELLEILNELESLSALEQWLEEFYFLFTRLKLWYNIQPIHYENTPTGFSSFRSKNTSPPTQNDQLLNEYFVIKALLQNPLKSRKWPKHLTNGEKKHGLLFQN